MEHLESLRVVGLCALDLFSEIREWSEISLAELARHALEAHHADRRPRHPHPPHQVVRRSQPLAKLLGVRSHRARSTHPLDSLSVQLGRIVDRLLAGDPLYRAYAHARLLTHQRHLDSGPKRSWTSNRVVAANIPRSQHPRDSPRAC
jgi:hypothetical protein